VKTDVINGKTWQVSAEAIPEYAGDYMLLAVTEGAEAVQSEFSQSGTWKSLAAVKNNKVYAIDFNLFLNTDPVSIGKQLELITDLLVNKGKK